MHALESGGLILGSQKHGKNTEQSPRGNRKPMKYEKGKKKPDHAGGKAGVKQFAMKNKKQADGFTKKRKRQGEEEQNGSEAKKPKWGDFKKKKKELKQTRQVNEKSNYDIMSKSKHIWENIRSSAMSFLYTRDQNCAQYSKCDRTSDLYRGNIGGLSTALQNAVDKPLMPVGLPHLRFFRGDRFPLNYAIVESPWVTVVATEGPPGSHLSPQLPGPPHTQHFEAATIVAPHECAAHNLIYTYSNQHLVTAIVTYKGHAALNCDSPTQHPVLYHSDGCRLLWTRYI
ncbi:unnamed protein product [Ranitomeya imitator]|uniref:Uncharacterized protein n=1 Tax=Ranitomeya imitator TaxID=111125 RepID=A0ABN9KZ52_9NEOB|nr:unnamed protein product [Ranitomeya imitator]